MAVELVVLVAAALAQISGGVDKVDGLDPLHLLEAQFSFVASSQRSAVEFVERLAVHLGCRYRQLVRQEALSFSFVET